MVILNRTKGYGEWLITTLLFLTMSKKKCRLIGFDSSTKSTGYAVFDDGVFNSVDRIDKSSIKDGGVRLVEMVKEVHEIIEKYSPTIVTWEVPVVIRNPQTQRDLSMLAGAIMGKCIEKNIFFYPLRPTEWRKLVKDESEKLPRKRDELKKWGINKVKELFNIEVENDDESDAILLCQAYMNIFKDGENND